MRLSDLKEIVSSKVLFLQFDEYNGFYAVKVDENNAITIAGNGSIKAACAWVNEWESEEM